MDFRQSRCRPVVEMIGEEATQTMLTGQYATRINFVSTPQSPAKCIPCLIGKSPQAPYQHNAKCASGVCELVHIDTCDPFPVLTP